MISVLSVGGGVVMLRRVAVLCAMAVLSLAVSVCCQAPDSEYRTASCRAQSVEAGGGELPSRANDQRIVITEANGRVTCLTRRVIVLCHAGTLSDPPAAGEGAESSR